MVPIYVKPPNDLSKARLLNGKDQYRKIITNRKSLLLTLWVSESVDLLPIIKR